MIEDLDPYVYPGTRTLQNRFGILDPKVLEKVERQYVIHRSRRSLPRGSFDLAHLRAHLFQDVYDWAGEIRTVEIFKGGNQFQFRQYIATGMADVHRRLNRSGFLKGLPADEFAHEAGAIMGDVNSVHPFREGNGRTQAQYLNQLAVQAGHALDLRTIDGAKWIAASKASHAADYTLMAEVIAQALVASSRG